jgi:hypothetical protein
VATIITSIGTNNSIATATPTGCSGSGGGSGYAVTFSSAPSGVSIGDKATIEDVASYSATFTYRVTNISGSTLTFVFVEEDTLGWGEQSPCELYDMSYSQAEATFRRFYGSPGEWATDLGNSDVYASSDDAVGQCHNDSIWTDSNHFASVSSLGSLNSIKLTVHPDSRHNGTTGSGARIEHDGSSALTPIVIGCNNFTVEWLGISGRLATAGTTGVEISSGATLNVLIQNMVIDNIDPEDDEEEERYGIKIIGAQASSIPSGSTGRTIRNNFVTRISASGGISAGTTGIGQSDSTATGGANCYHNSVHVSSSGGTIYAFYLSPACAIVNNLAYSGSFKITDDSAGSSSSSSNFSQGSSSASLGSGPGYGARDASDGVSITSSTNPALKLRPTPPPYYAEWAGTTPPTIQPHGYYNACVEAGATGYASNVDIFGTSWRDPSTNWNMLPDIGCAAAVVTVLTPGPATCEASTQGEYQSAATTEAVTVSPPTVSISDPPITPSAATVDAVTVNPTATLGSFSITPSAATVDADTAAPTIILGSVTVTPSAATANTGAVDPEVLGVPIFVIPDATTAKAVTVNPTVVLNLVSISVTPSAVTAEAQTARLSITFKLSGFSATSDAQTSISVIALSSFIATADAGTALGTILEAISPNAATAEASGIDPEVSPSAGTITANAVTVDPTVIAASISVVPSPATANADVGGISDDLADVAISLEAITADAGGSDPVVILGGYTILPEKATVSAETSASLNLTISLAPATAKAGVNELSLSSGINLNSITVTPSAATAEVSCSVGDVEHYISPVAATAETSATNPTLIFGSVTVTPSAATSDASTPTTFVLGISSFTATSDAGTSGPTVIEAPSGPLVLSPASVDTSSSVGSVILGGYAITPSVLSSKPTVLGPELVLSSFSLAPSEATGEASTPSPTIGINTIVAPTPARAKIDVYNPQLTPARITVVARAVLSGLRSDLLKISKVPSFTEPSATNEGFDVASIQAESFIDSDISIESFSGSTAALETFTQPTITSESIE